MKWIVVSDNHGLVEPLIKLKERYPDAVSWIHCGDSELTPHEMQGFVSVQGNNDSYHMYPETVILNLHGYRALVVHGHRVSIQHRLKQLAALAKESECQFVFFGHSHVFADDTVDGIRIMNPGSIWRSRDGREKSYGVFEIDQNHQISFTFHAYKP